MERFQIAIYLAAIALGLALGAVFPGAAPAAEPALWPLIAALLFATFVQTKLLHLRAALRDTRFLAAACAGNFLAVPVLVWLITAVLPPDPALRLGTAMVLLAPCTDWFIAFTHLSGGDTRRAISLAPLLLLLQLLLLPLYLWGFFGPDLAFGGGAGRMLAAAFFALILAPLCAAFLVERWAEGRPAREALVHRAHWAPVPLLACVMGIVALTHVHDVAAAGSRLGLLLGAFVFYLAAAAAFARAIAALFRLPASQGRVLAFSFGTRNSFVVLPMALALPEGLAFAAVVIVFQALVELFGMLVYLRLVPRRLFPQD